MCDGNVYSHVWASVRWSGLMSPNFEYLTCNYYATCQTAPTLSPLTSRISAPLPLTILPGWPGNPGRPEIPGLPGRPILLSPFAPCHKRKHAGNVDKHCTVLCCIDTFVQNKLTTCTFKHMDSWIQHQQVDKVIWQRPHRTHSPPSHYIRYSAA